MVLRNVRRFTASPSGWPRRVGGTGRDGQRVQLTPAERVAAGLSRVRISTRLDSWPVGTIRSQPNGRTARPHTCHPGSPALPHAGLGRRPIRSACIARVNIRLRTPKSRFTVPGAAPRASRLRAYSRMRCVVISLARMPAKCVLRFATRLFDHWRQAPVAPCTVRSWM
jgi:hypothetical protein